MEKTTLYLTDELQRALRAEARRTGRRQAELVRDAIRIYLGNRTKPAVRSVALGDDRELAARDSERWLERQWDRR